MKDDTNLKKSSQEQIEQTSRHMTLMSNLIQEFLVKSGRDQSLREDFESLSSDDSIVRGYFTQVIEKLNEKDDHASLAELWEKFYEVTQVRDKYNLLLANSFSEEEMQQLCSLAKSVSHIVSAINDTIVSETSNLEIENRQQHVENLVESESAATTADRQKYLMRLDSASGESEAMVRAYLRATKASSKSDFQRSEEIAEIRLATRKLLAVKYRDLSTYDLGIYLDYLTHPLVQRELAVWRQYEDEKSAKMLEFIKDLTKNLQTKT